MDKVIKILHLEDDTIDAELIQSKLISEGISCQFTLVQSRYEFESAMRAQCFDLVLADYNLPSYDGIKALKFTREHFEEIPFIFVSGTIGEEAAIDGLTKGATDYVLKQRLLRLGTAVKRAIDDAKIRRDQKMAEEELRKSEYRKTIFNKIASIFLTLSDEEMYSEIVSIVLNLTKSKFGLFGIIEENGDLHLPSFTKDIWKECQVPGKSIIFPSSVWGNSLWGRAIRKKKSFVSDGPFHIPHGHIQIENFLTIPIIFGAETIGLLSFANKDTGYTNEDKSFVEDIANFVSPILNARLQRDRQERIRKQAEEALRISEERFSKIFRLSPIACAILDVKNRRFVDVNEIFIKSTGYSRNEIIGHTPSELHLYQDQKEQDELLQILQKTGSLENIEFKIRNKAGIFGIGLNTTIQIELAGEKHYLSLIQDITERKYAENELRKLYRAVEQSPVSIIITDTAGKIEYVNSKFTEVTCYSKEEVLGQNPRILKSGEMKDEAYTQLWQAITSGKEWFGEFHNKKKNGELYWELASVSPILNKDGIITNFLAIKEDITKRKQAEKELIEAKEKAEESDKLKTAFLHNISHEIRTPMNSICGFSELLVEPDLSEEQRKYFLSIIQKSSNQLLSIVTDLLTISSIETKQENVKTQKVFINSIIEELFEVFRVLANDRNIQLLMKPKLSDQNSEIFTDQTKLTQVLTNLVSNAIKFTHKGFVEFGYNLVDNTESPELVFYVKDTGIGIKQDLQEKVFERFRQADKTIPLTYGGTGLGLSISKGLVELLGGKIWVESQPGEGSTFYFTIPYKPAFETETQKIKSRLKQDLVDATILVAEDEEFNYLYIKELLKKMDFKIIHAKDGQEAIEICKENPNIDLILMDIKMPVIDGDKAARIIRELKPELPIIAQSAYALEHERLKYEGVFDDYITKPINKHELNQKIRKYIILQK